MAQARKILDDAGFAHVGIQGNLDPSILLDGSAAGWKWRQSHTGNGTFLK